MLTREDLEALHWMISEAKRPSDGAFDFAVYEPEGDAIVGEFFGCVGMGQRRPAETYALLAACAPELALACLSARRLAVLSSSRELLAEIDAALEAAGIEIPGGEGNVAFQDRQRR